MKSGSLGARAKAAGMDVATFAAKNREATGDVGRLARMYFVMQSHTSGEAPIDKAGDKRKPGNPLYQIG